MPDEARKCDVPLPPESHWTTKHGESSVAVFAHAAAEESHARDAEEEEPYRWSYRMELTNTGHTTVQLMTRHLVLTTADGVAEERKGAGARGRLPVLAPGERFELSGAARLRTPLGALHGSLQFDTLQPRGGWGDPFSAHVARLGLLPAGSGGAPRRVPCAAEADLRARELPPTSVFNSYRVIVGASVSYAAARSEPEVRRDSSRAPIRRWAAT